MSVLNRFGMMLKRRTTYSLSLTLFAILFIAGCGSSARVTTTVPPKDKQPRVIVNQMAYSFYASGVLAEQEGDYPIALSYYQEALKHAPGNTDILYSIADLYYRLRRPQEALEYAKKIFYKDARTFSLIGNSHRVLGQNEEAINAYRQVVRLDPNDLEAHWYLGAFARQVSDFDEAVRQFKEVARLNPTSDIYVELAKLYVTRHEFDQAIESYRTSIALDPSDANTESYINLAGLLQSQNRTDEALSLMQEASSGNPNAHMLRLYLAEMYSDSEDTVRALEQVRWVRKNVQEQLPVLDRAGQIAFELNQLDLADSIFSDELVLYPESVLANFFRGRIAVFQERIEDAKHYFWTLVDVADSLPDGYINLGMIYLDQDSLDLAVDVLKEGVRRSSSGREEAQYFLATALGRIEKFSEVLAITNGLVKKYPSEIRYLFMHGSALERLQEFDSAAVVFENILTIDPQNAQTLNYLGYMWADLGVNLEKSKELIEEALRIDADNGAYLDSYGWVLYRLGSYEDAEKQIRRAIEIMDDVDPVLFDHLGDICYSLERYDEARKHWMKALEFDPDNAEIKEKLAR